MGGRVQEGEKDVRRGKYAVQGAFVYALFGSGLDARHTLIPLTLTRMKG